MKETFFGNNGGTMNEIKSIEEAVRRLEYLFQQCNERDEELLSYMKQLAASNDALKLNLHKLRTARAPKPNTTSSMHTKLSDALYE